MRRSWLALPVLVVVSVTQSFTASNVLPPSRSGEATQAIDANSIKPDDCALLDLTAVVTSATGTAANELVLGDTVDNTLTGDDGDDCLVAGDGDDTLDGGTGIDVCIGGAGTDTYDPSCETQIDGGVSMPPAAPTGLSATAVSATQIDLVWTDNAAIEDGFKIERSPGGLGSWTEIDTVGANVTTYSNTGLSATTTYDYRVRAYNGAANSSYSNTASATTNASCSSPGTQTIAANTDAYVAQSTPNTNNGTATSIYILSWTGANVRTLVNFALPAAPAGCSVTGATLRLNASGAVAGRTLEAYLAASSWTETGVTWNNQPATTGTAAITTSATGWMGWNVTTHVKAMYLGTNNGFLLRDASENGGAVLQTLSSREGVNDPELVITFGEPPPAPAAPSSLSATAMSTSRIDLSWTDNATDEDGFRIERSPGGLGSWTEIATVAANVTSYSNTGLSASTTYDYRVRAFNDGGNSAFSNVASATTQSPPPPPNPPSGLSATAASSSQIDLAWTDNAANEDGFRIERSPGGLGSWTEIDTVGPNVSTYSSTGLSSSTTYDYRVRAYNLGGNSSYSNTASATTNAACSAPGSQTIATNKDSWIMSNDTSKNNGADSNLFVQSKAGENWRTLVEFTLPSIPANCVVTAAKLRLNLSGTDGVRTIEAHMAGAAWTEMGVTWNNQPSTTGASVTSTTGAPGWQEWTVTQHVIDMYISTNNGWILRDLTESSSGYKQNYKSREGGSSTDPELVITFG